MNSPVLANPEDIHVLRSDSDTDTVLLDATVLRGAHGWRSAYEEFVGRHLPGAVYADLLTDFSDPEAPHPLTRPGPDHLARALGVLGIGPDTTVIAYDEDGGRWASRLWWLLHAIGHSSVRVLVGGVATWEAAGLPVASGEPRKPSAREYPRREYSDVFRDTSRVEEISAGRARGILIHALDRESFLGSADAPRSGHIPGAVNIPWQEQFTPDGQPAPLSDSYRAQFEDASEVVAYCGSGISATATLLSLHEQGLRNLALYDGSLTEWRADPHRPLEQGE